MKSLNSKIVLGIAGVTAAVVILTTPTYATEASQSAAMNDSSIQCPVGKIKEIKGSTVVCVSQNQEQTQAQVQNNNQNQNVSNSASATGGSSSSSSSSSSSVNLTVNNPTPAPVQVISQVEAPVKELPKTGLPLAGLALTGLLPAGLGIKRFFRKSDSEEMSANSIWMEKGLNS